MILDPGMASNIVGLTFDTMDPNTGSRIMYACAKQRTLVCQLGDGLIKKARPTQEEPEAACPGMGVATSSSMEMEPQYAWLSSAAGPAPAP